MASLYQRLFLRCPYGVAQTYLQEALASAAATQERDTIRLRVPLHVDHVALEKDVVVTYSVGHDPMHFDRPWRIHWTPLGGGPFPDFDGLLAVCADEGPDRSVLELRGHYTPPLGIVGQAFDALIGSRIASVTAREFLRQIGRRMEAHYEREVSQEDSTGA
ncbi:MAG: hypothetical protein JOZ38_01985 [Candidatus Eremiobacteraeota bacterium]|nr:hypothetical protein [Candidatus Eremiobacteraeota bacterium]